MDSLISISLVLLSLPVAAVSPGPSFVLVVRLAMAQSRSDGIAAAIGIGIAGVILSILALFGLDAVLTNIPMLYTAIKVAGGLYLIFLGIRIWQESK
jgi:threonine/homoserine/homoserine lactone efflux protein